MLSYLKMHNNGSKPRMPNTKSIRAREWKHERMSILGTNCSPWREVTLIDINQKLQLSRFPAPVNNHKSILEVGMPGHPDK
jgi:hypothetical protein